MLTLILLRHAKSSWKNPALADPDRPLAPRGAAAASLMGKEIAKQGLEPELVLCSSARRTRDTLALVLPELSVEPRVVYKDSLYHASSEETLTVVQEVPLGVSRVMVVGHNPELQEFGLDMIGKGSKHLRDKLAVKLPTAGLVVINFLAGNWKDLTVNSGTLAVFLTPKEAAT